MDGFVYEPIDLDRPALRLLHLLRGKGSIIECMLYQAFLDGADLIPYDALSYTWDGADKNFTVTVNGRSLKVTENLYLALQRLRSEHIDRVIWVDAICIDQNNMRERGHQVQQMCKIYSQAEEVVVWLGEATQETDVLMGSLQQLENHSSIYGYKRSHWDLSQWTTFWLLDSKGPDVQLRKGLNLLLSRPWFRRVWILQEIANAKRANIWCGTKSVKSHIFAVAPSLIGIEPRRHCQAVLDIMPGRLREETWWNENRDLYNLLLKFSESEASDPRDKVYALLGISSDAQDTDRLRPDYTKLLQEVIYDTSSFLFGPQHVKYGAMPEFLKDLASRSVAFFVELAKTSDVSEVDRFLKRRGLEVPLPEDVVKAAAANEENGQEIMSCLLQQRGHEILVTEEVIKAALGNKKNGLEIMKFLFQERRDEIEITGGIIKAAAANEENGLEIMKLLNRDRAYLWTIEEEVLEAAANNEKNGLEIIKILHQGAGNRWEITEGVIKAAARNEKNGLDIMKLLYQGHGNEFRITKGAIEAVRDNTTSGMEITNFLFQKFILPFSIIVVEELEVALTHDEEARGLLYDENTDSSVCDENTNSSVWLMSDIVWKASAEKIHMAIKMLLLYPGVDVDVEGGMHDTTPKPDPFKRHKAVLRLLLEPKTSSIAHRTSNPVTLSDQL
ncbi:hypothetical protein AA0111_g10544 [Alternaria arborescens]|nr:hypothetical protein AA0111_g10544 [Alternaria arborescens]RYO19167.1 hypothetical protein AA0111_g10544 [Alternaria arborescens]